MENTDCFALWGRPHACWYPTSWYTIRSERYQSSCPSVSIVILPGLKGLPSVLSSLSNRPGVILNLNERTVPELLKKGKQWDTFFGEGLTPIQLQLTSAVIFSLEGLDTVSKCGSTIWSPHGLIFRTNKFCHYRREKPHPESNNLITKDFVNKCIRVQTLSQDSLVKHIINEELRRLTDLERLEAKQSLS